MSTPYQPTQPGQPAMPAQQQQYSQRAEWGDRAIAYLWDIVYLWPAFVLFFLSIVLFIVGAIVSTQSEGAGGAIMLLAGLLIFVGWVLSIWRSYTNRWRDQGRTGWTYGKRKVGIRALNLQTMQPMGPGIAFVRDLLNGLINQIIYISYLWPLWDEQKQTLGDKVLTVTVIKQQDPAKPQG